MFQIVLTYLCGQPSAKNSVQYSIPGYTIHINIDFFLPVLQVHEFRKKTRGKYPLLQPCNDMILYDSFIQIPWWKITKKVQ